ncbi:Tetratricopeptide TPR_2 repeat protein [Candidatus Sulfopaludibacter sp. SbA3]|nr:Tetratricopeptide TPR_2 repeat protein [Candidatus Sulfopaludibacter sp. SbA3]
MVYRPIAITLLAGLSSVWTPAQTDPAAVSKALLDDTRTSAPAAIAPQAPTSPTLTIEQRGDILMARKEYREAIDMFRTGSLKDPVLWNKEGIAYHQLTQLGNARKSYEQALKLKPDYVEAMNNLGTIYYAQRSFRRAISWYNKALKLAPNEPKSASVYMNLGTAEFARKRYEQATAAYQTALKIDPDVFEHHGNFGVMLEEHSVQERAKYHYYVAKLYAKGGRTELALQYLRKALEEGFKDKDKLNKDPEFAGMRDLPEFKQLLASEPRVL